MKLLLLTSAMLLAARIAVAQEKVTPPPAKPEEPAEVKPYTLTDEERAAGWRILFDGRNNFGLRGLTYNDFINRGWRIDHGTLFCVKEIKDMGLMTGGHLITVDQYNDFEFAFEWKLSVSGKSGIMYFAAGTRQKPEGFIYSIIDDVHHPDGLKGGPIRRTGALYNIIPPAENKKLYPADHWNEGRIIVQGDHVEHWLNGGKVVEYTLGSPEFSKQLAVSPEKGGALWGRTFKTALVILDDGEEVEFRNLRVAPDLYCGSARRGHARAEDEIDRNGFTRARTGRFWCPLSIRHRAFPWPKVLSLSVAEFDL